MREPIGTSNRETFLILREYMQAKTILTISYSEKMRILQHSSSFTQSGHWGSDGIIIPENEILKNIIQNSEGQIELNFTLLKLLITWINSGTSEGGAITAEDVSVMNKISSAIDADYEQSIIAFHE